MPAPAEPRPGQVRELTRSECFELLAGGQLGRVAVTDDRGPVVFPVNYVLDRVGRAPAAPGHGLALEPGRLRPGGRGAPADRDARPARGADRHRHAGQRGLPDWLTLWLAAQDERWTYALPFERADHGFYRAAQHGLAAGLSWPTWTTDRVRTVPAADLVAELLPAARQGLLGAGVAAAEADRLLGVIGARAASGQTGAAWQRAALAAAEPGRSRDEAVREMFARYLSHTAAGRPVHAWS